MIAKRLLRGALVLGLGLIPAGAAMAQDRDQEDNPPTERRQEQRQEREGRRQQRARPDAEERRQRLEEQLRRRFEDLPGRLPDAMRFYRIDPEGRLQVNPGPFSYEELFPRLGAEGHGLGLTLRPVPEVLRSHLDLPEGRGLVVAEVAEGSPADGTIEENDILLRIGDTDVAEAADLRAALEDAEGDTVSITLMRRGEEKTVEVNLPRPAGAEAERYILGVTIETPDDAVRAQLGLPEGQGVIVMDVAPDSPAAEAGVKPNDILTKLGGEPIVGARELAEQVQEVGDKEIELTLLHDGEERTVRVTPEKRAAPPLPTGAPSPEGLRFFGPGVMIDPETGNVLPPRVGPGGQPGLVPFRDFLPAPASPELERQLDEILEQLKQLREEVDSLKRSRPEGRDRDGA